MNKPMSGKDAEVLSKLILLSLEEANEILNRMIAMPKKPLGTN